MKARFRAALTIGNVSVFLLGLILIVPTLYVPPVWNDWIFRISMLLLLSVSWNLMASTGLISLGHAGFWGVGTYAALLCGNKYGLPLIVVLIPATLCGALLGVLLAVATGRLRGVYFAICTLAMAEGLRVSALMLPKITGGAAGIFLRPELRPSLNVLCFIATCVATLSVAIAQYLTHTPFYYACRAIRNHETAAQMLGIDPRRYRMVVLALSGAMTSAGGGIGAWYGGYLDPMVAFSFMITVQSQIAPILGGMYSVAGAVLGSGVIIALQEATRIWFGDQEGVSQLVFGCILVFGILFMPQGVYGLILRAWKNIDENRQMRGSPKAAPAQNMNAGERK